MAKNVVADPAKTDMAYYYQANIKKYIGAELPKYERQSAQVKAETEATSGPV